MESLAVYDHSMYPYRPKWKLFPEVRDAFYDIFFRYAHDLGFAPEGRKVVMTRLDLTDYFRACNPEQADTRNHRMNKIFARFGDDYGQLDAKGFCDFYADACRSGGIAAAVRADLVAQGYMDQVQPTVAAAAMVNDALLPIGRLCNLRSLRFRSRNVHAEGVRLSLLSSGGSTSLRDLTINSGLLNPHDTRQHLLTDAEVHDIRTLGHLHRIQLACLARHENLLRLLQQPHALQWKRVSTCASARWGANFTFGYDTLLEQSMRTATVLDLLATQLPSLKSLCAVSAASLPHFARMSYLTCVSLRDMPQVGDGQLVKEALRGCTQLTRLHLCNIAGVDDATMTKIVACMPRLRDLDMRELQSVHTLGFLRSSPHLALSLQRLAVQLPRYKHASVRRDLIVAHVALLTSLRNLRIVDHTQLGQRFEPEDFLLVPGPPRPALEQLTILGPDDDEDESTRFLEEYTLDDSNAAEARV